MSKIIALIISAAAIFCSNAHASDVDIISKSIKSWQPASVTERDNLVMISMDTKELTQDDYERITTVGLCTAFWNANKEKSSLKRIKEIYLLNKYKSSGFVLETPHSTCLAIGDAIPEKAKVILLSNSRVFLP